MAAHWPAVAVTHGRRPRWKTPHAAAHVTGDASPPGTRRAGEAARGRRARPFPAGPPVSQPRASPPSCAETISRRRDNAKRRPGPASRAPAMPSVRPATQSTRLLSLHDGIPGTLPQCEEPLTRHHHPPHPPPQPHALRARCAPTFLRGARRGTQHSSRNSFHTPTRRGEARRLCGPSSGQKGPWPRRRQLLQVCGGRFSAAG